MDIVTYALSKKYTEDTVIGLGALKGSPCVVKKVEELDEGVTITLGWTALDGQERETSFTVANGVGVESIEINSESHLIFTMTDGSTIDAGVIEGGTGGSSTSIWIGTEAPESEKYVLWINPEEDAKPARITYSNPGVEQAVGGVTKGTVFADTLIQDVLDQIFSTSYLKPSISIGLSSKNVYDKNDKSSIPSTITISANVTKKSESIVYVAAYAGSTLIEKRTAAVQDGGVIKFTYEVPDDFETTTFKVECNDGHNTVSTTSKVSVVGLSYYGVVDDGVDISPTIVQNLSSDLKTTLNGSYVYSADYGKFVYAYPASFGYVTSVKDNVNNFNYTESCEFSTLTIHNETYNVVYLKDSMGFTDVKITYA